jgi:uncharacterized membrane protein
LNTFIIIIRIIFGLFLVYAGIMHFKKPTFFNGFIPNFLPKLTINYIFGGIELLLGIGLFFNQTAKNTAMGVFILMLLFLPIHLWDLSKEKPAIGSKKLALIRVPVQFLLMYVSYLMYTNS